MSVERVKEYLKRFGLDGRVRELIGHEVGGVCPFAVNDGVKVYLDKTLRKFEVVYPACGSSNSAVGMTIEELERASGFLKWVDVCKDAG